MDTSFDEEGCIRVQDSITCWVIPNKDTKDRIKVFTQFGFKSGASQLQRLEYVDTINRKYIIVKASVGKNDTLMFDYDIMVAGGIKRKAFVLAVKRFCSIPLGACANPCTHVIV